MNIIEEVIGRHIVDLEGMRDDRIGKGEDASGIDLEIRKALEAADLAKELHAMVKCHD